MKGDDTVTIRKKLITAIMICMISGVQGQARRGPKPVGPARKPGPPARKVVHLPTGARRVVIGGVPYWYHTASIIGLEAMATWSYRCLLLGCSRRVIELF